MFLKWRSRNIPVMTTSRFCTASSASCNTLASCNTFQGRQRGGSHSCRSSHFILCSWLANSIRLRFFPWSFLKRSCAWAKQNQFLVALLCLECLWEDLVKLHICWSQTSGRKDDEGAKGPGKLTRLLRSGHYNKNYELIDAAWSGRGAMLRQNDYIRRV